MIRHYTLPSDQLYRVFEAGGPLADLGFTADRLKDMSIAVVEQDGAIVAYWVCWYGLHVEPLWVQEEARKNPAVIKGIVQEMQGIVVATGEPAAFAIIENGETAQVVASYADRLGFHEAPGKLYYLVASAAAELTKV